MSDPNIHSRRIVKKNLDLTIKSVNECDRFILSIESSIHSGEWVGLFRYRSAGAHVYKPLKQKNLQKVDYVVVFILNHLLLVIRFSQ